jgi:predicted phosphoadenosine phosphosulfate sulfurtransferase
MTDLIVVPKTTEWQRLKALVLDSVSSPITKRVYNLGLDEFIAWYGQEPRPGFTKATPSSPVASGPFPSTSESRQFGNWPPRRPITACWRRNWPPALPASRARNRLACEWGTGCR